MANQRNLKRIALQSGCTVRGFSGVARQEIEGLFEVLLDADDIDSMLVRASENKSRTCSDGPVVVHYRKVSKPEADYLVALAPSPLDEARASLGSLLSWLNYLKARGVLVLNQVDSVKLEENERRASALLKPSHPKGTI